MTVILSPQAKATKTAPVGAGSFPASVTTLLNNQTAQNTNLPRASINWIIFDEQFKYVSGGFDMVGTAVNTTGTYKNHTPGTISIPKNGYIYIYCSNESKYPVFFDNIQVVHNRGPLVSESHFNAWGLELKGISSVALNFGNPSNKYKYANNELQLNEFSDGSGLDLYDFNARTYNQQIGRFIQIDPLSDDVNQEKYTPYSYSYNNPILYTDPDGKFGFIGAAIGALIGGVGSLVKSVIKDGWKTLGDSKTWKKAGVNALGGAIVGATGGLAGGLIATAATSFGTSLAEDAIDGNKLDFKKATANSITSTLFFGAAKFGGDKLASYVRNQNWTGNLNRSGLVKLLYSSGNTATNVAQVLDRTLDIMGFAQGFAIDALFPSDEKYVTLPGVVIPSKRRENGNIIPINPDFVIPNLNQIWQNNIKDKGESMNRKFETNLLH